MSHTTTRARRSAARGAHATSGVRALAPVVAAVVTAAALTLTGCTGSGEPGDQETSARGSLSIRTTNPLDGESADTVLAAAREALLQARLARVTGSVAADDSFVSFDITTTSDGQGAGWFSPAPNAGRATLKLIGRGLYLSGDDTYNRAALGAAAVPALHGKWVVSDRTDPAVARIMTFMDRRSIAATALDLTSPTVAVSPDGAQYLIRSGHLTLAVSRDGAARPLSLREDKAAPQKASSLTFGYPDTLDLSPPPPAAVLHRSAPTTPTGKPTNQPTNQPTPHPTSGTAKPTSTRK